MKDIISFYYNLNINKIEIKNKAIIILANNHVFIMKEVRNLDIFKNIVKYLTKEFYPVVLTKDGNLTIEKDKSNYALFEVKNCENEKLEDFNFIIVDEMLAPDYNYIWENNIKYYTNYVKTHGLEEKEIINELNYYLGMAEDALILYNQCQKNKDKLRVSICHYMINWPNYYLYYYDPTELTIDYLVKDLSEFVKAKFFYDNISVVDCYNLVNKYQLNEVEVKLFIARLIYPNYYFNLLKENMNNRKNTLFIIKKRNAYEHFLKELCILLHSYNVDINITWLS